MTDEQKRITALEGRLAAAEGQIEALKAGLESARRLSFDLAKLQSGNLTLMLDTELGRTYGVYLTGYGHIPGSGQ